MSFSDEAGIHVKEQTEAVMNLYTSDKNSSFLLWRSDSNSPSAFSIQPKKELKYGMVLLKHGLRLVGCISYNDEKEILSDLAIRPSSVDKKSIQKCLFEAAANHAKKSGKRK